MLLGLSPWMSNIDLIQALGGGWLADGGSSLAACQTANREADSRKQEERGMNYKVKREANVLQARSAFALVSVWVVRWR